MKTNQEVRRLFKFMSIEKTVQRAADRAGMDPKTARRYLREQKLPEELKKERTWRTRQDPFADVWESVEKLLETRPGLEAQTIFDELKRREPGRFQDGQLRTLQRRIRAWRATQGPAREVFFPQVHRPGEWCSSDFTRTGELDITIAGARFEHLLYHFVLPYSNWETASICFSETFESLSTGLQAALRKLGGVPIGHLSDRMSAAVKNLKKPTEFTERYTALLEHYSMRGRRTNPNSGHENGDNEQAHHRLKKAMEQAMLLRGSRDFASREEYSAFLERILSQKNAGRSARLKEERALLRPLPLRQFDGNHEVTACVRKDSTISVLYNRYSVHSRLRGERVRVRVRADSLEIYYGERMVERLPRLRGRGRRCIQYRHIIDSLVRKPGAFANYRYRADMFPTARFRAAYDVLCAQSPARADREYLRILKLAAYESEERTDAALGALLKADAMICSQSVELLLADAARLPEVTDVEVAAVDLRTYDALISELAS